MVDLKDSAIKLFGKTIPFRRSEEVSCTDELSVAVSVVDSDAGESCSDRIAFVTSSNNTTVALPDKNSGEEDKETSRKELDTDGTSEDDCKQPPPPPSSPAAAAAAAENPDSTSAEQSEVSDSQEKTPKKPDKIIPCPRCNSMETKFCYYNNYNVNQPRHFCKNCQRYWTAGGTMRNVPVGAGRRKNKTSAAASSHLYRHLLLPNSGGVLTFGSDPPPPPPPPSGDNHSSSCSSATASASASSERSEDRHGGLPPPCFPAPPPWPYFCHSGFPVSFYPAPPYWGPPAASPPGHWNVQCLSSESSAPEKKPAAAVAGGKRSRVEGEILDGPDRPVLIPKTLRIDDPTEAAKSSIWSTLGIKKNDEKLGNGNGGSLYNVFQSKGDGKSRVLETSPVLQANPAALSRSLRFLEST